MPKNSVILLLVMMNDGRTRRPMLDVDLGAVGALLPIVLAEFDPWVSGPRLLPQLGIHVVETAATNKEELDDPEPDLPTMFFAKLVALGSSPFLQLALTLPQDLPRPQICMSFGEVGLVDCTGSFSEAVKARSEFWLLEELSRHGAKFLNLNDNEIE